MNFNIYRPNNEIERFLSSLISKFILPENNELEIAFEFLDSSYFSDMNDNNYQNQISYVDSLIILEALKLILQNLGEKPISYYEKIIQLAKSINVQHNSQISMIYNEICKKLEKIKETDYKYLDIEKLKFIQQSDFCDLALLCNLSWGDEIGLVNKWIKELNGLENEVDVRFKVYLWLHSHPKIQPKFKDQPQLPKKINSFM